MTNIILSEAERTFILHSVEEDFRFDGRSRQDYRTMEIETDIVTHASGSARLRLTNTDILVGIKTEIDTPNPHQPDKGKIEFFVDCSANAAPEFEGRGGEDLAMAIANTLANAYESANAFNLKPLCILPGQQCWKLYVDVLILECGGNIFDAVSLAVKAALFNTKFPKVTAAIMDGGTADLILSDDPYDCIYIDTGSIPIFVTVSKVGDFCIVDPSAEEEECSTASVVIAISQRNNERFISNIHTLGNGSVHPATLNTCLELGISASESMNNQLMQTLIEEQQLKGTIRSNGVIGFLK